MLNNKNNKITNLLLPFLAGEVPHIEIPLPPEISLEDKKQVRLFRQAIHSRLRYYLKSIPEADSTQLSVSLQNRIYQITFPLTAYLEKDVALARLKSKGSKRSHRCKKQIKKDRIERNVRIELKKALCNVFISKNSVLNIKE